MKRALPMLAEIWLAAAAAAQRPPDAQLKAEAAERVEARRTFTQQMVDSIFSFAERGFQEFDTADYVTGLLEKEGFSG